MVLVMLAVLALALVAVWGVVLALAGRSSFPSRERRPVRQWGVHDLVANLVRGVTLVGFVDRAVGGAQTTKR